MAKKTTTAKRNKYTAREAADLLGVTRNWIRKLCWRHEKEDDEFFIDGLKVGREYHPGFNQSGFVYILDDEAIKALRKWLDRAPEGHKFRRISKG